MNNNKDKILELEVFNFFKKNSHIKEIEFVFFLQKNFGFSRNKSWNISKNLQKPFVCSNSSQGKFIEPMLEITYLQDSVSFRRMVCLSKNWNDKNENDVRQIVDNLINATVIKC